VTAESGELPRAIVGGGESRLARYLGRHELRHPDRRADENRARLLAGLKGSVIEPGCGDGRTFRHYPRQVERLTAIEPSAAARAEAALRARSCELAIEIHDGSGERLPFPDGSFSAAVCCFYLCSVRDPALALSELRRVLVPGGELRFYEHVASRNLLFRAFQRALDASFWPGLVGGCHTSRDSERLIREAGFEIVTLNRGFHSASLLTLPAKPYVLGWARALH
jgi:ubiquinone/menaquinone biosynthesis C-methylase UbiE